jgi:hypothetical protein
VAYNTTESNDPITTRNSSLSTASAILSDSQQGQAAPATFTMFIQAPSSYTQPPFAMAVPAPYAIPATSSYNGHNGAQAYFVNGSDVQSQSSTVTSDGLSQASTLQLSSSNGQTFYWLQPTAGTVVTQQVQQQQNGESTSTQAV